MFIKRIKLRLWVKIVLTIIIVLSIFFVYCRYFGTTGFSVKEFTINDSKISDNFYGLKIVHISDIHYKVTTSKKDLEKIINEINLLKPDMVILSGDLFNKNINYSKKDYENLTKLLNSIDYNIGKYAIKGDNDLNNKNWESIMNDSNFINLNDSYDLIYSNGNIPLLLVGISSNSKKNHIKDSLNNIYDEIKTNYNYSILVLHEPDFIDKIDTNKFNLILAGHSLGGQIKLPFIGGIIRNDYSKNYYDEYYEINNTSIYVSSGIGTDKIKLRFLNKPSINLYRLLNK